MNKAKLTGLFITVFVASGLAGCSAEADEHADAEEATASSSEQALSPTSECVDIGQVNVLNVWAQRFEIQLVNFCSTKRLVRVDIANFPDTDCVWVGGNDTTWVTSDIFWADDPTIRGVVKC